MTVYVIATNDNQFRGQTEVNPINIKFTSSTTVQTFEPEDHERTSDTDIDDHLHCLIARARSKHLSPGLSQAGQDIEAQYIQWFGTTTALFWTASPKPIGIGRLPIEVR